MCISLCKHYWLLLLPDRFYVAPRMGGPRLAVEQDRTCLMFGLYPVFFPCVIFPPLRTADYLTLVPLFFSRFLYRIDGVYDCPPVR